MTKRTRLEAMAEEYGDKTGSSILYGDWRKVYTDGIRRGIEMCRELCPSSPADPSCRRSQIDMLIKELEQEEGESE